MAGRRSTGPSSAKPILGHRIDWRRSAACVSALDQTLPACVRGHPSRGSGGLQDDGTRRRGVTLPWPRVHWLPERRRKSTVARFADRWACYIRAYIAVPNSTTGPTRAGQQGTDPQFTTPRRHLRPPTTQRPAYRSVGVGQLCCSLQPPVSSLRVLATIISV